MMMSLHLRPVAPQSRINRDTRTRLHKQLENELAEEAMSRELVSKHTAHRRDSQRFRETGDTEHPPP